MSWAPVGRPSVCLGVSRPSERVVARAKVRAGVRVAAEVLTPRSRLPLSVVCSSALSPLTRGGGGPGGFGFFRWTQDFGGGDLSRLDTWAFYQLEALLHRARGKPPPPVPPGAARRNEVEGGGPDPLGAAWEREYARDAWEGARPVNPRAPTKPRAPNCRWPPCHGHGSSRTSASLCSALLLPPPSVQARATTRLRGRGTEKCVPKQPWTKCDALGEAQTSRQRSGQG